MTVDGTVFLNVDSRNIADRAAHVAHFTTADYSWPESLALTVPLAPAIPSRAARRAITSRCKQVNRLLQDRDAPDDVEHVGNALYRWVE